MTALAAMAALAVLVALAALAALASRVVPCRAVHVPCRAVPCCAVRPSGAFTPRGILLVI